ncbi:VWA domain-containing protein [Gynuella sunshinyii]|uniref:Putative conserved protein (Some members containing a von Willebrand factor type A (VWA) domain) n=1 Tax=Gynuella sunshinyii YC6258 TaxID=1445510 RepID=A0A0C5VM88_9GAMM|nr:VWA domain-containing protein [Gynuella sunshinyii]AJQ95426.1 putative conserved protein (some members containing a von Willebrand factor type A (vWA) domain) [Gynuella sunshinyii YC6258]
MILAWPYALLLIPVAPLLLWKLPAFKAEGSALKTPFYQQWRRFFSQPAGLAEETGHHHLRLALLLLFWVLICLALSRPQQLGEQEMIPNSGRELLMAVDLSNSMQEQDLQLNNSDRYVNRLVVVKDLGQQFLHTRTGDRVGLIVFGSRAYMYAPISRDLNSIAELLSQTQIGMAGRKTAIGDALALAVKKLNQTDLKDKVVLLMTDGSNTSGSIDPVQAAELAKKSGIKIYAIGIGADEIIERSFFGLQKRNPSADLDENTLEKITSMTDGKYFRAKSASALEDIYHEIDKLEPAVRNDAKVRIANELFYWPAAGALLFWGIIMILGRKQWN